MKYRHFLAAALIALPMGWVAAAHAEGDARPQPPKEPTAQELAAMHKVMCTEHYAHKIAHLAYLKARLDLTDKQLPAWQKWADLQTRNATTGREDCAANPPKPGVRPTAPEREAEMERHLALQLQDLQATRPALQELYEVLNADQRALFDMPPEGPQGGPQGGPGGEHGMGGGPFGGAPGMMGGHHHGGMGHGYDRD